ncbi:MAG: hypothetical protein WDO74_23475 [Pseudomonadota bacterium]
MKTIFTTEPYSDPIEVYRDALNAWGTRHNVAVFSHGRDASFHYPGRTELVVIMPVRAADEYAALEKSATRLA